MVSLFKTMAKSSTAKSNQGRNQQKTEKNRKKRIIKANMKRLKAEMAEIREDQKHIKEGQREIRENFEEIESGCNQLMEETKTIAQQSAANQVRINLMFAILKARQDHNFAQADYLTQCLREETEKQKQAKKCFG